MFAGDFVGSINQYRRSWIRLFHTIAFLASSILFPEHRSRMMS